MKTKKLFTTLLILSSMTLTSYAINPINSLAKEIKVVYVFNNKTKKLTNIVLFEIVNKKGNSFLKKYENSSFFIGYLDGEYKEKNGEVLPLRGAKIVIYRNKKFLPGDQFIDNPDFISNDVFLSGDQFTVYFEGWPAKWYGIIKKNDKTQVVLQVL